MCKISIELRILLDLFRIHFLQLKTKNKNCCTDRMHPVFIGHIPVIIKLLFSLLLSHLLMTTHLSTGQIEQTGVCPKAAASKLKVSLLSPTILWRLATLPSAFRTWLPLRVHQRRSHVDGSISFTAGAQCKRSLLKLPVTLGPLVRSPNQSQLAGKCDTKTLRVGH